MGVNSHIFVNGFEIYIFKANNSEIIAALLCLDNISKDFSVDNMKKTGLYLYLYDFSVDYDSTVLMIFRYSQVFNKKT